MQSKQIQMPEADTTSLEKRLTNFWRAATTNPASDTDDLHPADMLGILIICVLLGTIIQ